MPLNLLRGGSVEEESVRVLVALLHRLTDVVTSAELVTHTVALVVEDQTTAPAEGLGGEEKDLRDQHGKLFLKKSTLVTSVCKHN